VAGTTDLAPHKSISGDRHGSSTCRLGKVILRCPFAGYDGGWRSCGLRCSMCQYRWWFVIRVVKPVDLILNKSKTESNLSCIYLYIMWLLFSLLVSRSKGTVVCSASYFGGARSRFHFIVVDGYEKEKFVWYVWLHAASHRTWLMHSRTYAVRAARVCSDGSVRVHEANEDPQHMPCHQRFICSFRDYLCSYLIDAYASLRLHQSRAPCHDTPAWRACPVSAHTAT
jgi:hypothetical protein